VCEVVSDPLFVIVGSITLVDMGIMPWWTRHGQEYSAPTLVGRSVAVAQTLLSPYESEIQIAERRFSADHPDGTILEQRPLPGAPIKKGRNFSIVLSRGSELIDVPVSGWECSSGGVDAGAGRPRCRRAGIRFRGSLPEGPSSPRSRPGQQPDQRRSRQSVDQPLTGRFQDILPQSCGLNIEEARDTLRDRGCSSVRLTENSMRHCFRGQSSPVVFSGESSCREPRSIL